MTPLRRMTLRLALYGAVVFWVAGDLFIFHGPLRRKLDRADPHSTEAMAIAKAGGVVARVFNRQITRSQLERALHERLWLEGKSPAVLTAENLKLARYAALNDLIDHELLRVKAKANAPELRVTEQEVDDRLRGMLARFAGKSVMERAMKSQGIASQTELRERIAARIQQEKYVEMRIGPLTEVTDDEAREWFAEHAEELAVPERVRARHVFLSTLNRSPDEASTTLKEHLSELASGSTDFATLAGKLSEDPASKERGGDLGWMSRSRLPGDLAGPVFSMKLHQPTLVNTGIGVHLVEVTDRQDTRARTFEEAREEVIAGLRTIRRDQAAREFRDALRRFEADKIEVFHDMLAE